MSNPWDISDAAAGQLYNALYDITGADKHQPKTTHVARIMLPQNENTETHLALLSKIMEAISIELSACDLVPYSASADVITDSTGNQAKLNLVFGLPPQNDVDKYQIANRPDGAWIWCDSLSEIGQSTDLKRALWSTLKHVSM